MEITEANIDYKLIGERIKEARKKLGWSQEKLGETIDVATVYISRIERGAQVNLRRLAQIAMVLKVPLEKLIVGTIVEEDKYLNKEFQQLLDKCTPDKQKLIYNIAKRVSKINFE